MTSLTSFWCLYCNFEQISHIVLLFVFIVDFEQENAGWEPLNYNETLGSNGFKNAENSNAEYMVLKHDTLYDC